MTQQIIAAADPAAPGRIYAAGAFSDPRVFLRRKGCLFDPVQLHAAQAPDGPTYLYIGATTRMGLLAKLATKYQLPLADLIAFGGQQGGQHA
jgi:hypothetical protein